MLIIMLLSFPDITNHARNKKISGLVGGDLLVGLGRPWALVSYPLKSGRAAERNWSKSQMNESEREVV